VKCCVALRYCYNMKHIIHIRCLKDNDKNRIYNISRCIECQSQTVQRSHEVTKVSSILGRKPGSPKGCHSYSRGSRDEGQVSRKWRHYYQQVCVQQPTYADNVALPAFARRCCSNRSIYLLSAGPPAANLQQLFCWCWPVLGQRDGQTDGHRTVS